MSINLSINNDRLQSEGGVPANNPISLVFAKLRNSNLAPFHLGLFTFFFKNLEPLIRDSRLILLTPLKHKLFRHENAYETTLVLDFLSQNRK